jgi:FkbM family methyltransferase
VPKKIKKEFENFIDRTSIVKINRFMSEGFNLRIDVGLSFSAPYLVKWARTNRNIVIVGFEPHPECFDKLTELVNSLPIETQSRIFIYNMAISDELVPCIKTFYSTGVPNSKSDPGLSSLLKPIGTCERYLVETIEVKVVSLNFFLNEIDYKFIEFLKIDTQGNDLEVIKSMKTHISNVYMIQAERDHEDFYENAAPGKDLESLMEDNKFQLIANSRDRIDSIFINTFFSDFNFIPFRLDLVLKKYPKVFLKLFIRSPYVFLATLSSSIIYNSIFKLNLFKNNCKHRIKVIFINIIKQQGWLIHRH